MSDIIALCALGAIAIWALVQVAKMDDRERKALDAIERWSNDEHTASGNGTDWYRAGEE